MKKLKFPFNCITLNLNEYQIKTEDNTISNLKVLFENNKYATEKEDKNTFNKNLKIKLFNFLHDLFVDQVFLGNEFIYVTDLAIHWSATNQKFFIISNIFFYQ
jgi:hypothetical protein